MVHMFTMSFEFTRWNCQLANECVSIWMKMYIIVHMSFCHSDAPPLNIHIWNKNTIGPPHHAMYIKRLLECNDNDKIASLRGGGMSKNCGPWLKCIAWPYMGMCHIQLHPYIWHITLRWFPYFLFITVEISGTMATTVTMLSIDMYIGRLLLLCILMLQNLTRIMIVISGFEDVWCKFQRNNKKKIIHRTSSTIH